MLILFGIRFYNTIIVTVNLIIDNTINYALFKEITYIEKQIGK